MSVTLITPTGGRPEAFALCECWMSRQKYNQWIVVDDCDPPTQCTLGQEVIRPARFWGFGDNTQHRNLLLALKQVKGDVVLIIEDDDYFAPTYIETMLFRLAEAKLVGEANARFYNVRERAYHYCSNGHHASLSQTGFRSDFIPEVNNVLLSGRKYIDMELWRLHGYLGRIFPCSNIWVGIKGMPGRPGIGIGHDKLWRVPVSGNGPWTNDPDMTTLNSWIGDDSLAYAKFFGVA